MFGSIRSVENVSILRLSMNLNQVKKTNYLRKGPYCNNSDLFSIR